MNHRSGSRSLLVTALLGLALPATSAAQRFVVEGDAAYPRIQYADSLYSLNDRCIVRMRRLSLSLPPVYVNGLPIGFC